MRRLFFTSFIAFALIVSAVPAAHAQDVVSPEDQALIDQQSAGFYAEDSSYNAETAAADSAAAQEAITQGATAPAPLDKADPDAIYNGVMMKIMSLFAWLVGAAMLTLNYAMYFTVVTMGEYVKNLTAVGATWTILRDIGNIFLIFGFLAVGVTTIMSVDWYGGGKKMLPMMLAAAVFLNFSLFITEAFIDVSNLFATQFYIQINGPLTSTDASLTQLATQGISGKIMNQLGLSTLYNVSNNPAALSDAYPWFVGFLGIILFIILAFVLFSLAFVLIARFIILLFLIIVSPIAFAGLAVPGLQKRMSAWWHKLFEQVITAPILLLMLYIALRIITVPQFISGFRGGADFSGSISGNFVGFAGTLLSFLVAMGMLLAVVIQSKNLSAFGASQATALAGRLTGAATFGALSLAGRSTLGVGGYLLNNKYVQRKAAGKGALAFTAKALSFTGRNLENKTFDLRNVPGAKALGGAAGAIPGLGSVFAGGATVTAQTAIDKTREGLKYVKPVSGEWWRESQKMYETTKSELDRKDKIAAAALPTVPPNTASTDAQGELKKMSVDEIAQLKDIRAGIDSLVHNLSPEKFNELMKSDKLLPGEKDKLKGSWDKQFTTAAGAATTMSRFNTEEIAALGGGTLTSSVMAPGPAGAPPVPVPGTMPVIDTLGVNEFEAIRRKGGLTQQQRRDIFDHMMSAPRGTPLNDVFRDYFLAANDPGENRAKYWNV